MKSTGIQIVGVVLSAILHCATCFLSTGHGRLMCCGSRQGTAVATARTRQMNRSRRGSGDALRMGAAGKKKKKLEKEALKTANGITKTAAREAQKEADVLAERLLEKCGESKRDLAAISADIADLRARTAELKPAQSADLTKDWRMVFATDDDALCAVATGLHKLPLTRMMDFFVTLAGGTPSNRRIQAIEVLRVLGPFPNLRNTLSGECRSTGANSLNIRYTSMIDGTGKETGSSATGEQDRLVDVDLAFVGEGALVLETRPEKGKSIGYLVFAKEPDLESELAKLRVEGGDKND